MFDQLINDLKSLNLPPGQFALFGSAPILVRGLRPAGHDLDVIVKQPLWDEYASRAGWVEKSEYLEWEGHNIELWRTWGPGEWDVESIIDAAEVIDGLPYVRLKTVLEWKQKNGRPKDLLDVGLIQAHLRAE